VMHPRVIGDIRHRDAHFLCQRFQLTWHHVLESYGVGCRRRSQRESRSRGRSRGRSRKTPSLCLQCASSARIGRPRPQSL
jgi:hypothetical protein